MEPNQSVLFFSKYSPICQNLLNAINACQFNFREVAGVTLVCVDNEGVRKRILESKSLKIDVVPSLLVSLQDGGVEKYEGQTVIGLIQNVINANQPTPPVSYNDLPAIPQSPEASEPSPRSDFEEPTKKTRHKKTLKVQRKPVKKKTVEPEEISESEEEENSGQTVTKMGDIQTDSDEEELTVKRRPAAMRDSSGSYSFEDLGDPVGVSQTPSVPEDATTKKRNNLMTAAQKMQHAREQDDDQNRPPGMPRK